MTTETTRPLDLAALIDQLRDLTAVAIDEEARWMPDLPPDGHEVDLPAPLPLMLEALRALEA